MCQFHVISTWLNILRPRQNGRQFLDDISKCIFFNGNVWISIKLSLKFVHKGPIYNIPALVQIMAWCRPCHKPLSEPMMVNLLAHIYASLCLNAIPNTLDLQFFCIQISMCSWFLARINHFVILCRPRLCIRKKLGWGLRVGGSAVCLGSICPFISTHLADMNTLRSE